MNTQGSLETVLTPFKIAMIALEILRSNTQKLIFIIKNKVLIKRINLPKYKFYKIFIINKILSHQDN